MSMNEDMCARHGRVLAELAEVGLLALRRLSDALLASDDVQVQAQLGLAFHRVSRAIRLTLALEARLARRPEQAPQDRAPTPSPPTPSAGARPPRERPDWHEYEASDANEPLEDLEVLLDDEDADPQSIGDAIETAIAHIRDDLAAANPTPPCHPGFGAAKDRDTLRAASATRPHARHALLTTASPMLPGVRLPRPAHDPGLRRPPWLSSA